MRLNIQTLGSVRFEVEVDPDVHSIEDVKLLVYAQTGGADGGIPPMYQTLIFAGQVLADQQVLSYYNAKDGATFHLVLRCRGSGDGFSKLCHLTSPQHGMEVGGVVAVRFDSPFTDLRSDESSVIRLFGPFYEPLPALSAKSVRFEDLRMVCTSCPEVPGVALYDEETQVATFAPSIPLATGADYAAKINGEVIPRTISTAGLPTWHGSRHHVYPEQLQQQVVAIVISTRMLPMNAENQGELVELLLQAIDDHTRARFDLCQHEVCSWL